jgi:prophage maintenance system killer protein
MKSYLKKLEKAVEKELEKTSKKETKAEAKGFMSPMRDKKVITEESKQEDIIEVVAKYIANIRKLRMELKNGNTIQS